ncbi:hypothetical protein [Legionella bononiensis]|uniref:Coiled coil protein n=1 Tax=Legionella bononiensis TaxID=2793102 RepID=A0ABS1WGA6_9GAMM|nr:hypothetical protein [Legionella bononiensis]MBL7481839.1 hypothetical protein [Legionella bononiensis]MBL7528388.1 hypothetical protein [Legionella bononiensis]MBL7564351.1 hypothetical protein [Legionella bononiensis]
MAFLEIVSSQEVTQAVQSAIDDLNKLKEVNEVIIENTHYEIETGLKDLFVKGKIDKTGYREMLQQNKDELALRYEGRAKIEEQLTRLEALKEPQDEPKGFIIPGNSTRDELKKLIVLMEAKKSLTDSSEEKLLLSVLLQTVGACKNTLDEKGAFENKSILLLKSEEQYVTSLLTQMENNEIHDHLQKKAQLDYIKNECIADPSLSNDEKEVLQSLCDSLSREVLAIIKSNGSSDEAYQDKIASLLNDTLEQSKEIAITSGFKGFINAICAVVRLEPVFTISNSPVIEKMKDIKDQLFAIKEEANRADEEVNTLHSDDDSDSVVEHKMQ